MVDKSLQGKIGRGILNALVIAAMICAIFPLLWMITTSFKTLDDSMKFPPSILPDPFTLEAYIKIISTSGVLKFLSNSAIYAIFGTFGALLFASLASYAFAKLEFRGRKVLFWVVIASIMIPSQVTLVPVFITLKQLGWLNTYLALIVPALSNAFGIFLIRQFALGLPNELFDAARIDGANERFIYAKIFLPLITPVIATLAVLDFMGRWNDLFWPLIVTNGDKLKTVQIALTTIASTQWQTNWNELTASMFLALIPILLLYIFFQKYFTEGISLTGLKG